MPHATSDEAMEDAPENEQETIARYIQQNVQFGEGAFDGQMGDYPFDQSNKASDAVDYEGLSDDEDLPEEEEATNKEDDGEEPDGAFSQVPEGLGRLPTDQAQSQTNGYGDGVSGNAQEQDQFGADLFGESDDVGDLFGEHSSSPEQHRTQPVHHAALEPPKPSGLALPGKTGLALPASTPSSAQTLQPTQSGPRSMSPPSSAQEDGFSPAASSVDGGSDEDLDPAERKQRELFKNAARRQAGETVTEDTEEIDMEMFYNLYPRFEAHVHPNFVELFPPRPVKYKGKVPMKPPKPLQPTKLSLDYLADQEKAFKTPGVANKGYEDAHFDGLVHCGNGASVEEESEDDLALSAIDENERIGGVTMQDLAMICEDWDIPSVDAASESAPSEVSMESDYETEERQRPRKKRRTTVLDRNLGTNWEHPELSFEDPERAAAKLAKSVTLDLNDPNLLIDEVEPPQRRKTPRATGDGRRDPAVSKDIARRYNISNDDAYDLLKENHQHKVRSTLGSMAVEHSLPATKLQYPFYRISLDNKTKRSFHRPHLSISDWHRKELKFQRPKHIKRKHLRGREPKDLFAKAEDLAPADNASVLMLEYSEEAPTMLSNFGMGNRLINYYRRINSDDHDRPKRELGETTVLHTQDKSPFANFGHVDKGEIVPTIQNAMYRAPVFQHKPKSTDFLVGVSSTHQSAPRLYLKNVENLHTVGQEFPLAEVPGEHSRKVTDAAKKRLRALSYRIYSKSIDPMRRAKALNNENLMPHLPGHDMPQTRSKMREFMKYERAPGKDSGGVWVPAPGQVIPDNETLRGWIKPEDLCLLDSMQVGVQHLTDLGISSTKEGDEDKEVEEGANIEIKLAPWNTTKNFLNACQGKAMLTLHGEGDPTGRGEGFNFVKTSMKGGFRALGESAEERIESKKRRENGGHTYNVAQQQKAYDDFIRRIWEKQKESLSADAEMSDVDMDDEGEEPPASARAGTPRSSFGGPSGLAHHDDESASQFSRGSAGNEEKSMTITRRTRNKYGEWETNYEKLTNPKVIKLYKRRRAEKRLDQINFIEMNPSGDTDLDALTKQKLERELARVMRNADRAAARDKAKGKSAASPATHGTATGPAAANSPAASEAHNGTAGETATTATSTADNTPQKPTGTGRGRNKDGTQRKCANCGQVGHIKTNRKYRAPSTYTFECLFCSSTECTPLEAPQSVSQRGRGAEGAKKRKRLDGDAGGANASAATTASGTVLGDSYSAFRL